ncbi:MAG: hypothetical protein IIT60_03150 [Muribaculaceae bacterium]|nr:hypothetical protein [Muribaculaceae bacterium]
MKKKKSLNEIVDVNGSKVFVENGEVRTLLSEEIQSSGYMSVDEMFDLIDNEIKAIYSMNDGIQGQ